MSEPEVNVSLCDMCHENESFITFTQIMKGQKTTINLCEWCAGKQNTDHPVVFGSRIFMKILTDLLKQYLKNRDKSAGEAATVGDRNHCHNCGLTWKMFKESGRLGCPHCYRAFGEKLNIVLRRMHGTDQHQQPVHNRIPDAIAMMKHRMSQAVDLENFELAAEYRDYIRKLERRQQAEDIS